ncbi:MAG: hypothetical protein FWE80_07990 [Oscillospiraceae bacterium]|nr:hypothetical protein [Oscillospiraceae bacterium]
MNPITNPMEAIAATASLPLVVADEGIARCAGNKGLFIRLLGKYANEELKVTQPFEAFAAPENQETSVREAHTQKGTCANLSVESLRRHSEVVEQLAKAGAVTREIYDGWVAAIIRTKQELREYIAANS